VLSVETSSSDVTKVHRIVKYRQTAGGWSFDTEQYEIISIAALVLTSTPLHCITHSYNISINYHSRAPDHTDCQSTVVQYSLAAVTPIAWWPFSSHDQIHRLFPVSSLPTVAIQNSYILLQQFYRQNFT